MGQGNKTRKRYLNKSGKINSLVEDTDTKEYYINDITGESIGKVVGGNIEAISSKDVKEIKENEGIIKSILNLESIS